MTYSEIETVVEADLDLGVQMIDETVMAQPFCSVRQPFCSLKLNAQDARVLIAL